MEMSRCPAEGWGKTGAKRPDTVYRRVWLFHFVTTTARRPMASKADQNWSSSSTMRMCAIVFLLSGASLIPSILSHPDGQVSNKLYPSCKRGGRGKAQRRRRISPAPPLGLVWPPWGRRREIGGITCGSACAPPRRCSAAAQQRPERPHTAPSGWRRRWEARCRPHWPPHWPAHRC